MSYYCERENKKIINKQEKKECVDDDDDDMEEEKKVVKTCPPNNKQQEREIERLRKQLERLQTKNAKLEQQLKYEKKGKKRSLKDMEVLFKHIQKNKLNREEVKIYLMEQLGIDNEYHLREMLDYLNKKVYQVYEKKEEEGFPYKKRRKRLLLKHDKEPERVFTLTLTNPITKRRYKKEEILRNIVDAVDAYLQRSGMLKEEEIKSSSSSDEEEQKTESSFMISNEIEEMERQKLSQCCTSKWYQIANSSSYDDNDSD